MRAGGREREGGRGGKGGRARGREGGRAGEGEGAKERVLLGGLFESLNSNYSFSSSVSFITHERVFRGGVGGERRGEGESEAGGEELR